MNNLEIIRYINELNNLNHRISKYEDVIKQYEIIKKEKENHISKCNHELVLVYYNLIDDVKLGHCLVCDQKFTIHSNEINKYIGFDSNNIIDITELVKEKFFCDEYRECIKLLFNQLLCDGITDKKVIKSEILKEISKISNNNNVKKLKQK